MGRDVKINKPGLQWKGWDFQHIYDDARAICFTIMVDLKPQIPAGLCEIINT